MRPGITHLPQHYVYVGTDCFPHGIYTYQVSSVLETTRLIKGRYFYGTKKLQEGVV